MNTLFHIFRFPILVFAANVILDKAGLYVALKWIDMPMHFLGGASIAIAGVSFLAFLKTCGFINELPFLVRAFFIMSFVGLAAVSWELWEFSLDFVFARHFQTDLFDTMADMFFGLLGGFVILMIWTVALSVFRRMR